MTIRRRTMAELAMGVLLLGCSSAGGGAIAGGPGGSPDGGGGQGGGGAGASGPAVTSCGTALAPSSSGVCSVKAGSGLTVVRGRIIAPDQIFDGGEVAIDSTGHIACVACDCTATAGYATASVVTCAQGVVSPALINSHDHITYAQNAPKAHSVKYDHRHEWRKGLDGKPKISVPQGSPTADVITWGELRFVLAGVTSTVGSGGATGLLRNLDKADPLQDGLGQAAVDYQTFPLGDSSGQLLTTCTYSSSAVSDAQVSGDKAFFPHVAEGVIQAARNEFLCSDGAQGSQRDYLKPQTAMIHAVGLEPDDVLALAKQGTGVVWSPRSNIDLYGFTAPVTELARAGVRIALGTDWSASGSMNLLRELACADSYSRTYLDGFFDSYALYRMVTETAAALAGSDTKLGALRTGLVADVTVWNGAGKDPIEAVVRADLPDVSLVLRGGLVLYGDAPLVDALSPDAGAGCEALDQCLAGKKVCAKREMGKTVGDLRTSITASSNELYPLYFCGPPDGEPSCVPSRPNEFTGTPSSTDSDGDGIPDATDLCPRVFSAARPMDQGQQPDADKDGVGDACDACPLTPGTGPCP